MAPGWENFYLLFKRDGEEADLMLSARGCVLEERTGVAQKVNLTQNWSSPPRLQADLIPKPASLYRRFGGDPVRIGLGKRILWERLFVGGVGSASLASITMDGKRAWEY